MAYTLEEFQTTIQKDDKFYQEIFTNAHMSGSGLQSCAETTIEALRSMTKIS